MKWRYTKETIIVREQRLPVVLPAGAYAKLTNMVKVRIFSIRTFSHIYYYIFKSIVFVFSGDKQDYKKNMRIKGDMVTWNFNTQRWVC